MEKDKEWHPRLEQLGSPRYQSIKTPLEIRKPHAGVKDSMGTTWATAALEATDLNGILPCPSLVHPPRDHPQHSKPLLMSSAKMMLVSRAGCVSRACTTAFWEHWRSSGPRGSMLATSGRVDNLRWETRIHFSGPTLQDETGPEARATALHLERCPGFKHSTEVTHQLQTFPGERGDPGGAPLPRHLALEGTDHNTG